jgi:hypothetical protein
VWGGVVLFFCGSSFFNFKKGKRKGRAGLEGIFQDGGFYLHGRGSSMAKFTFVVWALSKHARDIQTWICSDEFQA